MGQAGTGESTLRRVLALWVDLACTTPYATIRAYTADFSNTLSKTQIEEMATVDEFEVVKEVQVCLSASILLRKPHHSSTGILRRLSRPVSLPLFPHPGSARRWRGRASECKSKVGFTVDSQPPLYLPPPMHTPPSVVSSHLRAILGVLLSLKKRPVIRWERMSQAGRKLAVEVQVGPGV